jgi:hypothetical protein
VAIQPKGLAYLSLGIRQDTDHYSKGVAWDGGEAQVEYDERNVWD